MWEPVTGPLTLQGQVGEGGEALEVKRCLGLQASAALQPQMDKSAAQRQEA